jgi:hypothetical protein
VIGADARLRWSQTAHALAPLVFGIPVTAGIAVTLVRALGVSHPDLGFTTAINSDAEALYLGQTIYQDPADGYTGQLYTPLFPFLVSLLHHVTVWGGWVLLVNFAATFALMGLVAATAYRGGASAGERLLRLASAVSVGALGWWLVSALELNLLYDGRADHTAWALALFGLVLLAGGATGSTSALVGAAALLSAAFWVKQPTGVAGAAAVLWILGAAAIGVMTARRALAFVVGLVGTTLAVLGVLNLVTDGWEYYFNFELAREHPSFASFWPSAWEVFRSSGPALFLPVVLAAALAFTARVEVARRPRGLRHATAVAGRLLRRSVEARLTTLLLLFVLLDVPAGIYFRLKIGSDVNQYIGFLWAAALLTAIAYRRSRAHASTALLGAAAVVALFVIAMRPTDEVAGFRVAPLKQLAQYEEVSPELVRYANSHLVYHQVQSDLNVRPQGSIYPNFYNFVDLLAAGEQPRYLIRALLDRRFDAVAPFRFGSGQARLFWEIYASGGGRREANYLWKLNEVIRAGYGPDPAVPAGFLGRRPGGAGKAWMRNCFGPFRVGGVEFAIRAGGGFWCRGGSALTLRNTPAPSSEVHTLDPVRAVRGSLLLTLRRGAFRIGLETADGRHWAVLGQALPGRRRLRLEALLDGRPARRALVRVPSGTPLALTFERSSSGTARLAASGSRVTAALPDIGPGDLSVVGSRDSGLRLEHGAWEVGR